MEEARTKASPAATRNKPGLGGTAPGNDSIATYFPGGEFLGGIFAG